MIVSPLAHRVVEAANREPRRNERAVDMLLLHYTGMNSAAAACDLLCSEASGVSCHYLVDEDGTITQMVGEESRAWHAGVSCWQGETDTNSRSIGIEIQNPGHQYGYRDCPDVQMAAGSALPLPVEHEERGVYVAEGEIEVAGQSFTEGRLLVFRPGDHITLRAKSNARVMLLGGEPMDGPRYIWWNFVSSSKDRIEAAKDDWKQARFAIVPGDEKDFIPLPEK